MDTEIQILSPGNSHSYEFSFSKQELEDWITLSGDTNVIHRDQVAAAESPIGEMAVPGIMTAMIFSRVLGTIFPGHGTVYKSQSLEFAAPVKLETKYTAHFRVLSVNRRHHRARIDTTVEDLATGEICLEGIAVVINRRRL
jgi:acyl dehydratase